MTREDFQDNFCINFSAKLKSMADFFGEMKIKDFIENQLAAGKEKYDEDQFFRALSEVSILNYWRMRSNSGEYEPRTIEKKNPEARFHCRNGVIVDVEVKTPGFAVVDQIKKYAIPTVLLDDKGLEFGEYCKAHSLVPIMPRVHKLKEFLNSAAEKFLPVDHVSHINLLYINWSFSEYPELSYLEAYGLLVNPDNGLLVNRTIAKEIGVNDEVFSRISAVVVYNESLNGLMFGDFRYVWTRSEDGLPHFGIIALHNNEGLLGTTGMNSVADVQIPILLCIEKKETLHDSLMDIILRHVKR